MEATDFERQRQDYMSKIVGCNKDHSKEIDLYGKTYAEKIERVRTMMRQADLAFEAACGSESEGKTRQDDLQKASYYYQQALLVFYYLIPESDVETVESDGLKLRCHRGQA